MAYSVLDRLSGKIRSFSNDTDGAIAAFSVVTFMTMFLAIGMGVDFMRHEAQRAELQDALDRGVLAAAMAPNQEIAAIIVAQYLRTANFVPEAAEVSVEPIFVRSEKRVRASVSYRFKTYFLKIAGITTLNLNVASSAATAASSVEISLALDISGSMASLNTQVDQSTFASLGQNFDPELIVNNQIRRIDFMKVAATEFVDMILAEGRNRETTINLVPFAGQVNLGPTAYNHLIGSRVHNYSSCIDADPDDLMSGDLSYAMSGGPDTWQTPHFQYYRFEANYGNLAEWGWCPSDAQAIEYMSNDVDRLKERISDFVAHDGTGTPFAIAWALGLLDHRMQPLISHLTDQGLVEERFRNRPEENINGDTMKVIVLMSDGQTTNQPRPRDRDYDEESEIEYLASNRLRAPTQMMSFSEGSAYLRQICQSAKDQEVIVFTIGFDLATRSARNDLRDCATSEAHFYDVNGIELAEAFEAIATTVTKLRLVY